MNDKIQFADAKEQFDSRHFKAWMAFTLQSSSSVLKEIFVLDILSGLNCQRLCKSKIVLLFPFYFLSAGYW